MAEKKLKIRLLRNTFVKGEILEVSKDSAKNIHLLDREDAIDVVNAKKGEYVETVPRGKKGGEPIEKSGAGN